GERRNDVGTVAGPQERYERRPAVDLGNFPLARRLHFRDDRRAAKRRSGVGNDAGARSLIGGIAESGLQTRALLDDDFEFLLLDQSGDAIWCKRDSLLARSGFRWDADSH